MMNSNLLGARRKILELTKKYSSKRINTVEDLSFSDEHSKNDIDTLEYLPRTSSATENEVNNVESKELRFVSTSYKTLPNLESLHIQEIVEDIQDSDDAIEEINEIKRDSSEEDSDDSSQFHPLKNIHLVSDDILEDIRTASDGSFVDSDKVDERLSTHRSTPRSVRSIPLSPFISPPAKRSDLKNEDLAGYSSGDTESVIEEQIPSVTHSSETLSPGNNSEEKLSSESDEETSRESSSSEKKSSFSNYQTASKHEDWKSIKSSNASSVLSNVSESFVKESVSNSLNPGVENLDKPTSGKHTNEITPANDQYHGNLSSRSNVSSKSSRFLRSNRVSSATQHQMNNADSKNVFGQDGSDKYRSNSQPEDLNIVKDHDRKFRRKIPSKSSQPIQSFRTRSLYDKSVQVNSSENKYVQCNLMCKHHHAPRLLNTCRLSDSDSDDCHLHKSRKNRFQIDTNVKNSKHRPNIRANIELFRGHDSTKEKIEGYSDQHNSLESILLGPILRSQIDFARKFLDSQHRMYLELCGIAKSLNENYKKHGKISNER